MAKKNTSKRDGIAYESRLVAELLKSGKAIRAGRFYASLGVTDLWFVDKTGRHIEVQCKYVGMRQTKLGTKAKWYLSKEERLKLQKFAHSVYPHIKVYAVFKNWRKPAIWEEMI